LLQPLVRLVRYVTGLVRLIVRNFFTRRAKQWSFRKSLDTVTWALALALTLSLTISATTAQAKSYPKEEVRAAFLFNFLKFVEWPESNFSDASSAYNICMFGDIGSKDIFDKLTKQEAKSRTIQIDYSGVDNLSSVTPDMLTDCHIVYLGFMQTDTAKRILQATEEHAILTVSIIDNFIENGGMITLVTQGKKNVLRINLNAAQTVGLKISANMLDVAEIVEP